MFKQLKTIKPGDIYAQRLLPAYVLTDFYKYGAKTNGASINVLINANIVVV